MLMEWIKTQQMGLPAGISTSAGDKILLSSEDTATISCSLLTGLVERVCWYIYEVEEPDLFLLLLLPKFCICISIKVLLLLNSMLSSLNH